jgi:hypothetical protein
MSDIIRRRLADALHAVDMQDAAKMALEGYYDDFDSPLAAPKVALLDTLYTAAGMSTHKPERKAAILALRERIIAGEFDG